jgi:fructuronate reductase/mannitol 2-dehydrogenase
MHYADHQSASGPQEKIVQPVELNRINLARLKPPARLPGFDPTHVAAGIVHLGLGGFHRAHMARYTHDLMGRRPDMLGWGIIGAGLMPADRRMRDSLEPQDNLYTLVERSAADEKVTVVGSLARVIFAGESSAALLDAIDQPMRRCPIRSSLVT